VRRHEPSSLEFLQAGLNDLTPLRSWRHLRGLGLQATGISDLSPLAGFSSLRVLLLGRLNELKLETMPDLPDLLLLDLNNVANPDLRYIRHLKSLIGLNLSFVRGEVDVEPLLDLPALKYVFASWAREIDVTVLARSPSIKMVFVQEKSADIPLLGDRLKKNNFVASSEVPELKQLL
jgi:hypothetical protein